MEGSDSDRNDDRKGFEYSNLSENRNSHSGNKNNYNPPYRMKKDNYEEKSKNFSKNDYRHYNNNSYKINNRNSNKKRRHEDNFEFNHFVRKY